MDFQLPKFLNYTSISSEKLQIIYDKIISNCHNDNIEINDDFIPYAINFYSLDPKLQSEPLTSESIEKFVEIILKKLKENSSINRTLEMQRQFFICNLSHDIIVKERRDQLQMKTNKLTREIINCSTKVDHDKFMKKISIDIIVYNGLGNPGNFKILSDTIQALKSIMSKSDVNTFIGLPLRDKLKSLDNIRAIVCGIHVFNKDAGHSSDSDIIDLPQFVQQTCDSTKSILEINLFESMTRVNLLTSAISSAIHYDPITYDLKITLPDTVSDEQFNLIKSILIMNRQNELHIRQIITRLGNVKNCSESYGFAYNSILENLHDSVKFKTAVATELVFPKFNDLGQVWVNLQDQIYILSQLNSVNNSINKLNEIDEPYEEISFNLLGENSIETDNERMECFQSTAYLSKNYMDDETILEYSTKMKIELLGFCINSITEGNGILIPGNVKIGIGFFKGRYYSSSSVQGLQKFQINPRKMIYQLYHVACRNPELILFLNLEEQIYEFKKDFVSIESLAKMNSSCDVGVQTDLHPESRKFNENYTWNVWSLRKSAIKLADMRKLRTKSVQTMN